MRRRGGRPAAPLLEISGLGLRFGGIQALDDVGLTVVAGSVHAVIGPNGAGKSALLNCISGLSAWTTGPDGSLRLAGVLGRIGEAVKVRGMFLHPSAKRGG